jgi:hypothetical protein
MFAGSIPASRMMSESRQIGKANSQSKSCSISILSYCSKLNLKPRTQYQLPPEKVSSTRVQIPSSAPNLRW